MSLENLEPIAKLNYGSDGADDGSGRDAFFDPVEAQLAEIAHGLSGPEVAERLTAAAERYPHLWEKVLIQEAAWRLSSSRLSEQDNMHLKVLLCLFCDTRDEGDRLQAPKCIGCGRDDDYECHEKWAWINDDVCSECHDRAMEWLATYLAGLNDYPGTPISGQDEKYHRLLDAAIHLQFEDTGARRQELFDAARIITHPEEYDAQGKRKPETERSNQ